MTRSRMKKGERSDGEAVRGRVGLNNERANITDGMMGNKIPRGQLTRKHYQNIQSCIAHLGILDVSMGTKIAYIMYRTLHTAVGEWGGGGAGEAHTGQLEVKVKAMTYWFEEPKAFPENPTKREKKVELIG